MKGKGGKLKLAIIIIVVICIVGAAVPLTLKYTSKSDTTVKTAQQTYTVSKGSISNEISAAGNLALAQTDDLAFEVAGTVYEVEVSKGDTVTKGQELAKLDTTEWQKSIKTLEKTIVTAQRNLSNKQAALIKTQRSLTEAERGVTAKQLAVQSAQLAVQDAQYAVTSANDSLYSIKTVAAAQTDVDEAELLVKAVSVAYVAVIGGGIDASNLSYWQSRQQNAAAQLVEAKAILADIISETGVTLSSDVQLQIQQAKLNITKKQLAVQTAQLAVQDAQIALDNVQYTVTEAKASVQSAQNDVDDAQSALQDAQDALDEANSLSPVITAPYDGFIPSVNIKGGDEVMKGTVAMQIADPDKFKVDMSVSEVDISNIKVGGKAYIEIDALSITLPGTVTYIAPTATISSGVVNYSVTVEVESVSDYIAELKATSANMTNSVKFPSSDNGTMPSMPAFSGNMTMPSFNQGNSSMPSSQNGTMPGGFGPQLSIISTLESAVLKSGMSVTVSLVVSEATDVLLVPYNAVTTERSQSYVQVLKSDGTTEKRAVTTGLNDYSYYEITNGLADGEQVVITATSSSSRSTSVTTTQSQQGGGMIFPGMNGGSRPSGGGGLPGGG
jgi:HlyD family secretion protein